MQIKTLSRVIGGAAGLALKNNTLLRCGIVGALALSTTIAAQAAPSPVIDDGFAKAKEAPTAEGKWEVTATAIIRPLDGQGDTLRASGPVTLDGNGVLVGTLPMQVNDAPPADQTLEFSLKQTPNYSVGLRWLIAGKPFLGRPAQSFTARALPGKEFLTVENNWNGKARKMEIYLTSRQVTNKPPRIRIPGTRNSPPPIRRKGEPIGKRYKVSARLVVTNSEDGVFDNTIEIDGKVEMTYRDVNGVRDTRILGTIIPQPLGKNASLPFATGVYVDELFSEVASSSIIVNGLIVDQDSESGGDSMWDPNASRISLKKWAGQGEYKIAGDGDSESCDVYITITAMQDLY